MNKLYNKFLFYFFPLKLVKRYTSKWARRMYFIREYEVANNQIFKAGFQLEQRRNLREEIRREYDKANETLNAAQGRLETENVKQDPDKTIKESLAQTIETKKKEISQFKEQIDQIDAELKGYTEAIDSIYAVLPEMLKEIKK